MLKNILELVDTSLCKLYYLYAKPSKNDRELKNLFNLLEGICKMYSAGVHPMKAPVCAGLIKRYLQWVVLLKNSAYIPNICKMSFKRLPMPKPGGALEGRYAKLVDVKVLLY